MSEEQGRIRCAYCKNIVSGIPTEMREPRSEDTQRLTTYFCGRKHLSFYLRDLEAAEIAV